jgi:tryptophanase
MEPFEPYRIKVVEAIPQPTADERAAALERAGHNLFLLRSAEVTIDLLTDSGTGAMSDLQWSAMMAGDEAYAGSSSWETFRRVLGDLTGFPHILPTHQGRAAEFVLFSTLLRPGDRTLSNSHFDTTRANVQLAGGVPIDLPSPEMADLQSDRPFKGDIDLVALAAELSSGSGPVAAVIMTLTNNFAGGQPVSMANLRAVRSLCDQHRVPLVLDACRFAENAWFVGAREDGYAGRTPRSIAQEAFALADATTISLKKDGLANIGGMLGVRDPDLAQRCTELLIATEGYLTYGGLAGRDLSAIAQGVLEVTDARYLASRAAAAARLADRLEAVGVPTVRPTGAHAVYADAAALLPHIPPAQFPAHALGCALYLEGGIRTSEIGTLSMGMPGSNGGPDTPAPYEFVRLALPRRTYTRSHLDYVAEVFGQVAKRAGELAGYRIVRQPASLRHFSATLAPLG